MATVLAHNSETVCIVHAQFYVDHTVYVQSCRNCTSDHLQFTILTIFKIQDGHQRDLQLTPSSPCRALEIPKELHYYKIIDFRGSYKFRHTTGVRFFLNTLQFLGCVYIQS